MSVPKRVKLSCAVCSAVSEQTILLSTNRFGAPDLDLRPAEMMRSTMPWWIQECPKCNYVSTSINNAPKINKHWLMSDEYQNCPQFASRLAKSFYRHYLICRKIGAHNDAFQAALRAAWCCDDMNDTEKATLCRTLALEELHSVMNLGRKNDTLIVVKSDILRRSGRFDEVIKEFYGVELTDKLCSDILSFEVAKAKEKDSECYTVDDVTNS